MKREEFNKRRKIRHSRLGLASQGDKKKMKQKVEWAHGGSGQKKRKEKKEKKRNEMYIADKLHRVLGSYKLIRLQQLVTICLIYNLTNNCNWQSLVTEIYG
jgi:hypothetical protein